MTARRAPGGGERMLLSGRNAIVTGANRGIGRAIVEAFAQNGARVWAHARRGTPEFLADMAAIAGRHGVEIEPVIFDVTDKAAMKAGVRQIAASKRPVDVLVNNAGIAHGGLFQMTSVDTIREVFEVNFFSVLELSQPVVRLMQKNKKGSIVNIASICGIDLKLGNIAYGVSKAALMAATKTMAAELGAYGIRVNAIAPGLTDTDMANLMAEKARREMVESASLKRPARPEEIAGAAVFLASDMASFVSGHVLCADGGAI
jgi:3-oxoacyl-[acyl-carrier protein] reductase